MGLCKVCLTKLKQLHTDVLYDVEVATWNAIHMKGNCQKFTIYARPLQSKGENEAGKRHSTLAFLPFKAYSCSSAFWKLLLSFRLALPLLTSVVNVNVAATVTAPFIVFHCCCHFCFVVIACSLRRDVFVVLLHHYCLQFQTQLPTAVARCNNFQLAENRPCHHKRRQYIPLCSSLELERVAVMLIL